MNVERAIVGFRHSSPRIFGSLKTESTKTSQFCYRNIPIASLAARPLIQDRRRLFSSTVCLLKKGGKQAREDKNASRSPNAPTAGDPFDLSGLESEIDTLLERLKVDLSKLRGGGRFNTEALENLRVKLDKSQSDTSRLNDLAQVVPKGRTIQVLVGEKDHVKPITSSIQSSSLSLTPQPDPTGANPLLLTINIPPPTAESRKAVVTEAKTVGEKASTLLRDARSKQQKKFRALQTDKTARPDDVNKAMKKMEQVVEKGGSELKKIVENVRKMLESG